MHAGAGAGNVAGRVGQGHALVVGVESAGQMEARRVEPLQGFPAQGHLGERLLHRGSPSLRVASWREAETQADSTRKKAARSVRNGPSGRTRTAGRVYRLLGSSPRLGRGRRAHGRGTSIDAGRHRDPVAGVDASASVLGQDPTREPTQRLTMQVHLFDGLLHGVPPYRWFADLEL
jgi:hypothetical protein